MARRALFLGQEIKNRDGFLPRHDSIPDTSPAPAVKQSGSSARITPAVLFITVVLAVVLFVAGLLHVLRRLFLKSHHGGAGTERQLQQLFQFHPQEEADAGGLQQAAIDALPVFPYCDVAGCCARARPFDCAVCLSEFVPDDRLRLLPLCGHAFHAACIDTWLRSSSTCPLCRCAVVVPSPALVTATGNSIVTTTAADIDEQKPETAAEPSVILAVRLGRFKNPCNAAAEDGGGGGECSTSSTLGSRRCYSMGSRQYVLADDNLVVSVHWKHSYGNGSANARIRREAFEGKKLCAGGRGDSFSVSKIWQWRGSRELPEPVDGGLPWGEARK